MYERTNSIGDIIIETCIEAMLLSSLESQGIWCRLESSHRICSPNRLSVYWQMCQMLKGWYNHTTTNVHYYATWQCYIHRRGLLLPTE